MQQIIQLIHRHEGGRSRIRITPGNRVRVVRRPRQIAVEAHVQHVGRDVLAAVETGIQIPLVVMHRDVAQRVGERIRVGAPVILGVTVTIGVGRCPVERRVIHRERRPGRTIGRRRAGAGHRRAVVGGKAIRHQEHRRLLTLAVIVLGQARAVRITEQVGATAALDIRAGVEQRLLQRRARRIAAGAEDGIHDLPAVPDRGIVVELDHLQLAVRVVVHAGDGHVGIAHTGHEFGQPPLGPQLARAVILEPVGEILQLGRVTDLDAGVRIVGIDHAIAVGIGPGVVVRDALAQVAVSTQPEIAEKLRTRAHPLVPHRHDVVVLGDQVGRELLQGRQIDGLRRVIGIQTGRRCRRVGKRQTCGIDAIRPGFVGLVRVVIKRVVVAVARPPDTLVVITEPRLGAAEEIVILVPGIDDDL